MDIEDIENGLGAFNADQQDVLNAILNINIKNQAILESILAFQIEVLGNRVDRNALHNKSIQNIEDRILSIQAEIVKGFNSAE